MVKALGPTGVKGLPVRTILALPQIRDLLSQDAIIMLEDADAAATIGDLPSEAWVAIALSAAETSVRLQQSSAQESKVVNEDDQGLLIICKSCSKPHWYDTGVSNLIG